MRFRHALSLLTCAVLLAACSSSSGSNSDANAVYGQHGRHNSSGATGASGGSQAHGGSSGAASSGHATSGHPVNPSLTSGFGGSSHASNPAGGGTSTSSGGGHTSNCVESHSSGAHIVVCPGIKLSDGMQVKVTGDHFHPTYKGSPEGLLVMECDYKGEAAANYGPNDCDINILNLAPNSTQANPDGTVSAFLLTVKLKFKSIDCSRQQCMVTVAQPLQSETADNPHALISFS